LPYCLNPAGGSDATPFPRVMEPGNFRAKTHARLARLEQVTFTPQAAHNASTMSTRSTSGSIGGPCLGPSSFRIAPNAANQNTCKPVQFRTRPNLAEPRWSQLVMKGSGVRVPASACEKPRKWPDFRGGGHVCVWWKLVTDFDVARFCVRIRRKPRHIPDGSIGSCSGAKLAARSLQAPTRSRRCRHQGCRFRRGAVKPESDQHSWPAPALVWHVSPRARSQTRYARG
jgi:hypothetical protein